MLKINYKSVKVPIPYRTDSELGFFLNIPIFRFVPMFVHKYTNEEKT
jgi:hypothetical protein